MSSPCDKIQRKLVKLHLTRLPITDDPEVKAHLDHCPTCRIYNDHLDHDHRELRTYADSLDTYVDRVKEKLHHRINAEDKNKDKPNRSFIWWSIAAMIPLGIALIWILQQGGGTESKKPLVTLPRVDQTLTPPGMIPLETELEWAQKHFDQGNVPELLRLLDSEHPETRIQVAHFLGQVGDGTVVTVLERLARTWDQPDADNPYAQSLAQIEQRLAVAETIEPEAVEETIQIGRDITPDAPGVALRVTVKDQDTGLAIPDTPVVFSYHPYVKLTGRTDVNGVCRIGCLEETVSQLRIKVDHPGYVAKVLECKTLAKQDTAYVFPFILERGQTIGGEVIDVNGLPVAGVKVTGFGLPYPLQDRQIYTCLDFEKTTDDQGRWVRSRIPISVEKLSLNFHHPEYAATDQFVVDPLKNETELVLLQTLQNLTHTLVLQKGYSISGYVFDPNGEPVEGANISSVTYSVPEKSTKTNREGFFKLQNLRNDSSRAGVLVSPEMYPPCYKSISLTDRDTTVNFELAHGQSIEGWIIDSNTTPISGAEVVVRINYDCCKWSGWRVTSDDNGYYRLTGIYTDQMDFEIKHPQYLEIKEQLSEQSLPIHTVLHPKLNVQVFAHDSETKEPISSFKLIPGQYFVSDAGTSWEKRNVVNTNNGQAFIKFDRHYEGFRVMVEASGYQSKMSRVFLPGETQVKLNLALEAADEVYGKTILDSGEPLSNVKVFQCRNLLEITVANGVPLSKNYVRSDANGRFQLDSGVLTHYLVAVCDEGFAQVSYEDFLKERTVVVEPWVKIRGRLMKSGVPVVGYQLKTSTHYSIELWGGCHCYSKTVTDDEGLFEFDRIPPGYIILYGREYRVQAGQEYELELGEGELLVTGKLPAPNRIYNGRRKAGYVISLSEKPIEQQNVFQRFFVDEKGKFEDVHLIPGQYALVGCYFGEPYRYWHTFDVPEESDRPLDLGEVDVLSEHLTVGESAPDFNLVDLQGESTQLSDYKGKLVLLSFYPLDDVLLQSEYLEDLYDIHSAYVENEQFMMFSLISHTHRKSINYNSYQDMAYPWPHLLVGRNRWNKTHVEYEVFNRTWPWNILVSPAGTILSNGLENDALLELIELHLP